MNPIEVSKTILTSKVIQRVPSVKPPKLFYNSVRVSIASGARYIPPLGFYLFGGYPDKSTSQTCKYVCSIYDDVGAAWRDNYGGGVKVPTFILSDGENVGVVNKERASRKFWLLYVLEVPEFSLKSYRSFGSGGYKAPADGLGRMIISNNSNCFITAEKYPDFYDVYESLGGAGGGLLGTGYMAAGSSGGGALKGRETDKALIEVE